MAKDQFEETPVEDADRVAPHGWEVEYLSGKGEMSKTNHPAAEVVVMEATIAGSQSKPALVLYDQDDEQIALYSPEAWLACRRNARPNGEPARTGSTW